MSPLDREQLDLVGRIMLVHQIEPHHASSALEITIGEAISLTEHGIVPTEFSDTQKARLQRFLNFLIRIEWKLQNNAEIRRAIELPLACLGDRSPAEILSGSEEDLRLLRGSVDQMEVPKTKWWRIGH